MRRSSGLVVLLVVPGLLWAATLGGPLGVPTPLFPSDNWWNVDVSAAPLDPGSAAYVGFIGSTRALHPDFGGEVSPGSASIYGIPYVVVDGSQPKKAVAFTYWSESDGGFAPGGAPVPFYPIPDEAITQPHWIEGGAPGNQSPGGDRHMLIVDRTNNHLYELFDLHWNGAGWTGGSGAFFDMGANDRRPDGWTSADAAGLAILPGLVRYDEACGSEEIQHAFRFTVRSTNGYVWPASHRAGSTSGALPMGARMRLKASVDISASRFPDPCVRRVFRAMKTFGVIVADNGSDMFVSGAFDTRWPDRFDAGFHSQFKALRAGDFEVVKLGWTPAAATPAVRVTTPNGSESWPVGSRQQIRWTSHALGSTSSIRVSLLAGGGITTLVTVPHDQTSWTWTVDAAAATDARIKVECVGCSTVVSDESDAGFAITAAVTAAPEPYDLNLDNQPDVLWHNQASGHVYAWLMNGVSQASGSYLAPSQISNPAWQVRALADFNKDGKLDILWHNQGGGDLYIWFMDGLTMTWGSYLTPNKFSNTQWQIRGVGDFNADDEIDILWHNQVTGYLYVWYLDGLNQIGGSYLTPNRITNTAWQIKGLADFDDDGDLDILWHNQGGGDLYVWLMNGVAQAGGSYLTPPGFSNTAWQIRELADFNGDDEIDILWHNQVTGHLYVWYLNGLSQTGGTYLSPDRIANTAWQIAPR